MRLVNENELYIDNKTGIIFEISYKREYINFLYVNICLLISNWSLFLKYFNKLISLLSMDVMNRRINVE